MKVRVDIDVSDEQVEKLMTSAAIHGCLINNQTAKIQTIADKKETIRLLMQKLVEKEVAERSKSASGF
jgi:hypothetical protein